MLPSAALALLLATVATGCEWIDPPGTTPPAVRALEVQAGTPAAIGDPSIDLPLPPPTEAAPAEPVVRRTPGAAPPIATFSELASLRPRLGVPVAGVTRAQLRDTFAEARGERVHEALDILAARGTPVLSAADGRLLRLFDSRAGGLMVYATDVSERFILLYGHLDSYADGVRDGMPLVRGQVIGYVGTTGNAPAGTPHLHFGILRGEPDVSWSEGIAVNPYPLLAASELSR